MAITNANYWPLGSTIQKVISLPQSPTIDQNMGIISVNPIDGHMVMVYRGGSSTYNSIGSIYIRYSTDGGANWSVHTVVKSESNVDLRNISGGYDSNGRLFIFYLRCTSSTYISINYIFSDNNGLTWSSTVQLVNHPNYPNQSNAQYWPHGHIVDAGNDILYQTWWGVDINGTYSLYLYKSADAGVNFLQTDIITTYSNSLYQLMDSSMVNLGGGCFLVLARIRNTPNHFRQFKSEDNLVSWTDQGETVFESPSGSVSSPPWLSFINLQGDGIVACYYTIVTPNQPISLPGTSNPIPVPPSLNVVFGLAKDLLNTNSIYNKTGIYGWNTSTIKKIYSYSGTNGLGYQSFYHPLNQFKGIGVCFDYLPFTKAQPRIVFTNTYKMIDDVFGNLDL